LWHSRNKLQKLALPYLATDADSPNAQSYASVGLRFRSNESQEFLGREFGYDPAANRRQRIGR